MCLCDPGRAILVGTCFGGKKKEHFVMGTLVVVGTFCRCPRVRRYFEVQFSVRIRTAVRLE